MCILTDVYMGSNSARETAIQADCVAEQASNTCGRSVLSPCPMRQVNFLRYKGITLILDVSKTLSVTNICYHLYLNAFKV